MAFFKERIPHFVRKIADRLKRKAPAGTGAAAPAPAKNNAATLMQRQAAAPSLLSVSPEMQRIHGERDVIVTNVGWSAERSVVSDGQVHCLLANHKRELSLHGLLLAADTLILANGMKRLAGFFPLPEVLPPAPPREKNYPTVADLYGERPKARLN
jgi:hypothetical protein